MKRAKLTKKELKEILKDHNTRALTAVFCDMDLSGIDLRFQNLGTAVFYNTSLVGADLRFANFSFTNFLESDLTNAKIENANFSTASFNKTKLIGLDIINTSIIHGLDLDKAIFHEDPEVNATVIKMVMETKEKSKNGGIIQGGTFATSTGTHTITGHTTFHPGTYTIK